MADARRGDCIARSVFNTCTSTPFTNTHSTNAFTWRFPSPSCKMLPSGAPAPLAVARTRTRRGEGEKGTHGESSENGEPVTHPTKDGAKHTSAPDNSSDGGVPTTSLHPFSARHLPSPSPLLHGRIPNPKPIFPPSPPFFCHWNIPIFSPTAPPFPPFSSLPTSAIRPWLKCHPFFNNSFRRTPHTPRMQLRQRTGIGVTDTW
jgi:hypothetical protein